MDVVGGLLLVPMSYTHINTMNVWAGMSGAGMEWLTLHSYFNVRPNQQATFHFHMQQRTISISPHCYFKLETSGKVGFTK